MSWVVNSGQNHTHGSGSQIHPYRRREVERQGSYRVGDVQEEGIDHQLHSAHVSFSLGIPEATGVSLHRLYVSPQLVY